MSLRHPVWNVQDKSQQKTKKHHSTDFRKIAPLVSSPCLYLSSVLKSMWIGAPCATVISYFAQRTSPVCCSSVLQQSCECVAVRCSRVLQQSCFISRSGYHLCVAVVCCKSRVNVLQCLAVECCDSHKNVLQCVSVVCCNRHFVFRAADIAYVLQ